jgi:hypothetical protein
MLKRIAAIGLIFVCTSAAWMLLGATIFARTYERAPGLREKVVSNWGGPHAQKPPYLCLEGQAKGPESSRVAVDLHLDQRQKGLLWYSTYAVKFDGVYGFRNDSDIEREATIIFPFASTRAIYDDLRITIDGQSAEVRADKTEVSAKVRIPAGKVATMAASYRSQGLDEWRYEFGKDVTQVKDFQLNVTTDFGGADFPDGTLSPTSKERHGKGWGFVWSYRSLMTGQQIGVVMPQKLQPGPLAGQISYFAPVSLLFFFFVICLLTTIEKTPLHPVNYFFLAAAFFAFHLLLAYLADHVEIHAAFAISAAVSVFLVVSYLRLVAGFRFAAARAGVAQFIYLVLFSYAFFFRGFTGLAITIGAIATLFVAMQLTARVKWA